MIKNEVLWCTRPGRQALVGSWTRRLNPRRSDLPRGPQVSGLAQVPPETDGLEQHLG
jgi:hypothetical protein